MTRHPDTATLENLTPAELLQAMRDGKVLLIDVREPDEFAAERIPGAFLYPLSSFDPGWIPAATPTRSVVFQCGSGKRSANAAAQYVGAGAHKAAHLAGGIAAWKAAGLPTVRIDPATGSLVTRGSRP